MQKMIRVVIFLLKKKTQVWNCAPFFLLFSPQKIKVNFGLFGILFRVFIARTYSEQIIDDVRSAGSMQLIRAEFEE